MYCSDCTSRCEQALHNSSSACCTRLLFSFSSVCFLLFLFTTFFLFSGPGHHALLLSLLCISFPSFNIQQLTSHWELVYPPPPSWSSFLVLLPCFLVVIVFLKQSSLDSSRHLVLIILIFLIFCHLWFCCIPSSLHNPFQHLSRVNEKLFVNHFTGLVL